MGPFIPHKIKPRIEHESLQVGQHLRMIHRYSIGGRRTERWDQYGQIGDTATVAETYEFRRNGTIVVRWDNPRNTGSSRIDSSCFEVINEPPPFSPSHPLRIGDRVRMVSRYSIGGGHSTMWDRNAQPGDTAQVTSASPRGDDGTVIVEWEHPRPTGMRASRIDAACFEVIGTRDIPIPPGTPGTGDNLPMGRLTGEGGITCVRCNWATPSTTYDDSMREWREHRERCI